MITRIALRPAVRDELFSRARSATCTDVDSAGTSTDDLVEICGVLGGVCRPLPAERASENCDGTDPATDPQLACVTDCRPVPNVADRPGTRYELDPESTIDAIETLEAADREHLGFYHSHPRGPTGPSHTDHAQATWSGYVYLIVSLGGQPVIGGWRWTGEAFVQLPIELSGAE